MNIKLVMHENIEHTDRCANCYCSVDACTDCQSFANATVSESPQYCAEVVDPHRNAHGRRRYTLSAICSYVSSPTSREPDSAAILNLYPSYVSRRRRSQAACTSHSCEASREASFVGGASAAIAGHNNWPIDRRAVHIEHAADINRCRPARSTSAAVGQASPAGRRYARVSGARAYTSCRKADELYIGR